jgi:hypothetical protein
MAFEALRDQSLSLQARGEVLWMRDANLRVDTRIKIQAWA